jgi:hypothetical protein
MSRKAIRIGVPDEWRNEVDQFLELLEVLVVQAREDDTYGAIPALTCRWCQGRIVCNTEGDCLWIHDGGQGVDLYDPFIMFVVHRIRETHPDWKLRSCCKICSEELTFLEQHACLRSATGPAAKSRPQTQSGPR